MRFLRTEHHDAVQTVWLDNPPYNFLTEEVMSELLDVLCAADADPQVRAVVLTSAVDGVFVSHYSVAEILAGVQAAPIALTPRTAAAALLADRLADRVPGASAGLAKAGAGGVANLRRYHKVCALMRGSSTVFVAAINGRALGGGCELALACDIRLMADGPFEIGQPEILVGIIPGGGGTQMLTRVVGTARALELCLEGSPITPRQACDIGLVHRLVAAGELLQEARVTAARLAKRSPTAVAAIKHAVYEGGSGPLDKGLRIEQAQFLTAASTPSAQHAMATYLADIDQTIAEGGDISEFVAGKLPEWVAGTKVEFTE
ncbi:enoyl-CoA hydratase/isomerase family protein [Nocardia jejuensis]|uniref:enoyl-CoA hydratase/isomerase family protein n=1 Tax=Nocardia jejuensis TaxID=328049 RepID=UPI00082E95D9|nr:enoyl-CoA hydratase/isomerase family protein [Nocardia jejuensis]